MRREFNETFEQMKMPKDSKDRVLKKLMNPEENKRYGVPCLKKGFAFAMTIVCMLIVSVSIVAANPDIIKSLKSLFKSNEEAVKEVYDKQVGEYKGNISMADGKNEKSSFNEEELVIEQVAYMGDTMGVQMIFQYAVNLNIAEAVADARPLEVTVCGEGESYFVENVWKMEENGHGYFMITAQIPTYGDYTLRIKDFVWGDKVFEGIYETTFSIKDTNFTTMYRVDKDFEAGSIEEGEKKFHIDSIAVSPLAMTISMTMPENFNSNKAFMSVIVPNDYPDRDDLYLLNKDKTRADVKMHASYSSMWETNGLRDEEGSTLTKDGAKVTLIIRFEEPISLEQLDLIHFVGNDIEWRN